MTLADRQDGTRDSILCSNDERLAFANRRRQPNPDLTSYTQRLRDLAELALRTADQLETDIARGAAMVSETVAKGGTLLFCGNGGSAADAQHMAAEFVVRYTRKRRPVPAIALTTDTSILTAAGNDFGFETIFARQIEALGKPGDLLIAYSTSGTSPNVLRACEAASAKGIPVLALTAGDGGKLKELADHSIVVPTDRTDRAQEIHLSIGHLFCELVEAEL